MLDRLREIISLHQVLGSISSFLISATLGVLLKSLHVVLQRRPVKLLLGEVADRKQECLILIRHFYGIGDSNKRVVRYRCDLPDPMPPRTSGQHEEVINTPYVISKADVQAATDVLNVLGQVGKKENITLRSVYSEWDRWDTPMVLVGGSKKAEAMLKESTSPAIRLGKDGTLTCLESGRLFDARNENDHGLVMKTRHKDTGKTHLLVMGVGFLGTEAAGYYLRAHANTLGKMYGGRGFAVIVHTDLKKGSEGASLRYFSPAPTLLRKLLHPFLCARYFRKQ